jgi:hypothetical protein
MCMCCVVRLLFLFHTCYSKQRQLRNTMRNLSIRECAVEWSRGGEYSTGALDSTAMDCVVDCFVQRRLGRMTERVGRMPGLSTVKKEGEVFAQRLVGEDELRLPLVRIAELALGEYTPTPSERLFSRRSRRKGRYCCDSIGSFSK